MRAVSSRKRSVSVSGAGPPRPQCQVESIQHCSVEPLLASGADFSDDGVRESDPLAEFADLYLHHGLLLATADASSAGPIHRSGVEFMASLLRQRESLLDKEARRAAIVRARGILVANEACCYID